MRVVETSDGTPLTTTGAHRACYFTWDEKGNKEPIIFLERPLILAAMSD